MIKVKGNVLRRKEKKIFLAKKRFVYYSCAKEFAIKGLFCRAILIFFLSLTNQPCVFADIKDKKSETYRVQTYEEQSADQLPELEPPPANTTSPDSNFAMVHNDIGVDYEQMGLQGMAQTNYLEAIRLDKNYLPAYFNLASFYKKQGDLKKAGYYFKKRMDMGSPRDPFAKKARQEYMNLGRPGLRKQADLESRELSELTGSFQKRQRGKLRNHKALSDEYFRRGNRLLRKKDYEEAIAAYEWALSLNPDDPRILTARQKAVSELKQQSEVMQTLP